MCVKPWGAEKLASKRAEGTQDRVRTAGQGRGGLRQKNGTLSIFHLGGDWSVHYFSSKDFRWFSKAHAIQHDKRGQIYV